MTRSRGMLAAILGVYLVVGGLFAIFTPAWQAPDEPAHYNYVAQLARGGCCPVIESGDWDSAYLETLKANRFRPDLLADLPAIQYEDHQPPLYYLLQTPVYLLTNGSLIALRLVSVLLGGGIVMCAYAVGRMAFPQRPQIALGAAALVAFLPQHVAILASVTNDALSNLLIGIGLVLAARHVRGDGVRPWQMGVLAGIALLTKISTIFLVGLLPLAILARFWLDRREERTGRSPSLRMRQEDDDGGRTGRNPSLPARLAAFVVPALLLGGIWWARSISVYGFPDVFGLRAHDRVVADQARTADLVGQIGLGEYLSRAVQTTFNSFWGQFGWMGVPMPGWVYTLIVVLLIAALLGWLLGRRSDGGAAAPEGRWIAALLGLTALLAVAQYLYYNLEFLQLQGRYMFTGLIPATLGLAWGIENGRAWLARRVPALRAEATPLLLCGFAVLDVYLLWRVIVPALAVTGG
ncbi:MAG: DUF2142 domain-containing protein [Anaerolineae bacterium]|nr:DUF2142 domain-containing protein [Anaerolineae bacterium]